MFKGLIADTPGFSSMEFDKQQPIKKERLQYCFREFLPFLGFCKFTAVHTQPSRLRGSQGAGRGRHCPIPP
jgi:putative ribosome biogenesis GTPase RsgA